MRRHSGSISGTGMITDHLILNLKKPRSNFLRSYDGLAADKPWQQGKASVNVNQWLKYFNVRSKAIDMVAGSMYIVKIEPIDHVAKEGIRDLPIKKRLCLYKDEKESLLNLIVATHC